MTLLSKTIQLHADQSYGMVQARSVPSPEIILHYMILYYAVLYYYISYNVLYNILLYSILVELYCTTLYDTILDYISLGKASDSHC